MKIAILGTHGIGKSTFAAQMFAHASRVGQNARLIHEVARNCPFPLNDGFTSESAIWIMCEHIRLELDALSRKAKFIICDRSALDPMVYLVNKLGWEIENTNIFKFAKEWLNSYDMLIHIRPSSEEIISDGIRSPDPKFRKEINTLFSELLADVDFDSSYYLDDLHDSHGGKRYLHMSADDVFSRDNTKFFEHIFNR
ncbi:MAG: ATP-binding protein [Parachlamydia sp.]|nr:ATP-binding protein [Parachlamydia sp.]